MAEDFNQLASQFGVQIDSELGTTKNEGFQYHQYKVGKYMALVGQSGVNYVDKEKKKCEKDTPGATKSNAFVKFIIVQDPDGRIIDNTYQIKEGTGYGRIAYHQFITLDPAKQFQNVSTFADFTINGMPQLSIIQGEKGKEDIHLELLPAYYGCPIEFEIVESDKGSKYINRGTLLLLDHSLSQETFQNRKKVMDTIYRQIDRIVEEARARREASKGESSTPRPTEEQPDDPDDFLNGFK